MVGNISKVAKLMEDIIRLRMDIEKGLKCKFCGSGNVVRYGKYKGVQRYFCKNCKRKFVDNDALPKMKTPVRQIASAISGYYGGMSLDSVARHLEQQYGNPSIMLVGIRGRR